MRPVRFLLLTCIISSLIISGCLREYNDVWISNVDVMSVSQDDGTKLTVTTYIQNNQKSDSGVLSLKIKTRDPTTNLIVAEKDADVGYIKSRSQTYNIGSLMVTDPGEYKIEVQLFEGGNILDTYYTQVIVKGLPGPGQPADIKLTDMMLEIKQYVNGVSNVVVDVSPGIFNQGGDSQSLTMEVTARVNPYTGYTENDDLGIIKASDRVRGNVRFVLPKNTAYTFSVSVIENGKTVASGNVEETIKLNEIRWNTPMTYVLVEEGKPIVEVVATKQPGFLGVSALFGILLVYSIVNRARKKK
jgi:hypothetical protein